MTIIENAKPWFRGGASRSSDQTRAMNEPDFASRVMGCLLGDAIGDAFGYEIEFDSLARIRQRFGPANHGGDSDSTASIARQIAGAEFGVEGIPQEWRVGLDCEDELSELASELVSERRV